MLQQRHLSETTLKVAKRRQSTSMICQMLLKPEVAKYSQMTLLYSQAKQRQESEQSLSNQSQLITHIAQELLKLDSIKLSQHRIETEIKLVANVCLFTDFELFAYAAPTIKFFKLFNKRCYHDMTANQESNQKYLESFQNRVLQKFEHADLSLSLFCIALILKDYVYKSEAQMIFSNQSSLLLDQHRQQEQINLAIQQQIRMYYFEEIDQQLLSFKNLKTNLKRQPILFEMILQSLKKRVKSVYGINSFAQLLANNQQQTTQKALEKEDLNITVEKMCDDVKTYVTKRNSTLKDLNIVNDISQSKKRSSNPCIGQWLHQHLANMKVKQPFRNNSGIQELTSAFQPLIEKQQTCKTPRLGKRLSNRDINNMLCMTAKNTSLTKTNALANFTSIMNNQMLHSVLPQAETKNIILQDKESQKQSEKTLLDDLKNEQSQQSLKSLEEIDQNRDNDNTFLLTFPLQKRQKVNVIQTSNAIYQEHKQNDSDMINNHHVDKIIQPIIDFNIFMDFNMEEPQSAKLPIRGPDQFVLEQPQDLKIFFD